MRLRALAFIALLAVSLSAIAPAGQAHAEYASSDPPDRGILPQAPTRVTITLSEAVQVGTPSIRLTDVNGTRLDAGPTNLSGSNPRTFSVALRAIGPGVYTVAWNGVSAVDGHFTAGSFAFAVQSPDGTLPGPLPAPTSSARPISLLEIAGRFLSFAGLAVALGAALVAGFLWIPAGEASGLADRPSFAWGYRALLQWGWAGSFMLVLGTAALWVNTLTLFPPADPAGLVGSPFLAATAARLALGLALTVTLWIASRRSAVALSGVRPVELLVAAALGFGAIIAGTAGTHSAAASWGLAGPIADAVHLVGVAIWVGGLLALLRLRPWLREPELAPVAGEVFVGFSTLAGYAVALLLGAGVVLSLILVGSWDGLFGTAYGWLVLAKVSLFAPMVAVGAWNRYRVLPATENPARLQESVGLLARNVRVEAILGAIVLALAAILTSISPAAAPNPGDTTLRLVSTSGGIQFVLQVLPFPSVPGVYTFELLLYNAADGTAYTGATNGTLRFTLLNSTLTPSLVPLEGPHPPGNHFFIPECPNLSQPGVWKIEARISRTTGPDVAATFNVAVGTGG
jgi:copper transport protein